jgi:antitoxin component YwqK of YwqJK toxin-antitoxin module
MRYCLLFVTFLLFSCSDKTRNHIVTIKKGNEIIKGNIINDTLFNDTIWYYDLNDNLLRKRVFKDGKENGLSIEYYLNKKPMITTLYSNGLKNGYNTYYDSGGKYFYKDFYYYDLTVGPAIFFDTNENPKRFYFMNLQNETLLDINYQDWHGIKDVHSKCINFISNVQKRDSTKEISLLLYLINPPKFSFNYTVLKKKKKNENDFVEVKKIESKLPFINISLPILPNDENYTIGLNVYDSILNKETVIYDDF